MTELGNRLKDAREAKGLSLDELQNITKIQKRYLIGIEDGNYAIMPGKFYIRAFIKQYAEAVDLNPEEIFDLYKEDVPAIVNTELPELSRVQSRRTITDGSSKVLEALPKIIIGIFLIGAASLIYYLYSISAEDQSVKQEDSGNVPVKYESGNLESKKEKQKENNITDDNSGINTEDTTIEEEPADEPETPPQEVKVVSTSGRDTVFELKNADRFELKLVSTGETWVDMKNGKGFSHFQGMLIKGETESHTVDYSKESEAVLVIGNSVNTEIYINDQKIDYAIAPTDEVRQDIVIRFSPSAE